MKTLTFFYTRFSDDTPENMTKDGKQKCNEHSKLTIR